MLTLYRHKSLVSLDVAAGCLRRTHINFQYVAVDRQILGLLRRWAGCHCDLRVASQSLKGKEYEELCERDEKDIIDAEGFRWSEYCILRLWHTSVRR